MIFCGRSVSLYFVLTRPNAFTDWLSTVTVVPAQLWPFYCHEQTTGPYSRLGDKGCAVKCRSLQGVEKIVRLFPQVLDVLHCLKQQVCSSLYEITGAAQLEYPLLNGCTLARL